MTDDEISKLRAEAERLAVPYEESMDGFEEAVTLIASSSGWDSEKLRAAAGPPTPPDETPPLWQFLLRAAAFEADKTTAPPEQGSRLAAGQAAMMALNLHALHEPHGRDRQVATLLAYPRASLEGAFDALPAAVAELEELPERFGGGKGAVLERARALLADALHLHG